MPVCRSRRRGSVIPTSRRVRPGLLRLSGFYSKPELQKLNRNSIYIFVNKRLIRDRLLLHAISEAYRNIIPPTSSPVVLLFLEMPPEEVDVNVHPAKTEVRFRQQSLVHDFVRDSIRSALIAARPGAGFRACASIQSRRQPGNALADSRSGFTASRLAGSRCSLRRAARLGAHWRTECRRRLRFRFRPDFPQTCLARPRSSFAFCREARFRPAHLEQQAMSQSSRHRRCSHPPAAPSLHEEAASLRLRLDPRRPSFAARQGGHVRRSKPSRRPRISTASARCGRWASFASRSFWPQATRVSGLSINTSHTNGCLFRKDSSRPAG